MYCPACKDVGASTVWTAVTWSLLSEATHLAGKLGTLGPDRPWEPARSPPSAILAATGRRAKMHTNRKKREAGGRRRSWANRQLWGLLQKLREQAERAWVLGGLAILPRASPCSPREVTSTCGHWPRVAAGWALQQRLFTGDSHQHLRWYEQYHRSQRKLGPVLPTSCLQPGVHQACMCAHESPPGLPCSPLLAAEGTASSLFLSCGGGLTVPFSFFFSFRLFYKWWHCGFKGNMFHHTLKTGRVVKLCLRSLVIDKVVVFLYRLTSLSHFQVQSSKTEGNLWLIMSSVTWATMAVTICFHWSKPLRAQVALLLQLRVNYLD